MSSASERSILAASVVWFLAASVVVRGADDVIVEETAPVMPTPPPSVRLVPPRLRIEMRQQQGPLAGAAGGAVRRAPYLGVVTAPIVDQLRAQLDLPKGVGLAVEAVADDGPAGRAGVRKFDVLRRFDDQIICTSEQLSALVRAAGKGRQVRLTVIRGGKEKQLDVLIEDREVPIAGAEAGPFAGLPGVPLELETLLADGLPGFAGDLRGQVQRQVQEAMAQAQGLGGKAAGRLLQIYPGAGGTQNVVVVSDQRGTVEIRENHGKRTVSIKDPAGQQVHAGPLDDEADRDKLPESYRAMVDEVAGWLAVPAAEDAADAEEKPPAAEAPEADDDI
ncbi:MAG: PDZ domain-containing protein [Planctomycetes bacterium]|nr:PDZ domain-containing protein [Planctomycetota bacterium]